MSEGPTRAELSGSDACSALGMAVCSPSPVLELCRALVAAGIAADRPLHAYRGDVLCLKVRSIGEWAELQVNARGTGFARASAVRTAPPMRETASPLYGATPS